MSKKNIRTLIMALLILAICGMAYVVIIITQKQSSDQQYNESNDAAKDILVSMTPDQVKRITYEQDGTDVVFEQIDGKWTIPGDDRFVMNENRMVLMLGDLASLRPERTLTAVDDLEPFGLGENARKVIIEGTDGTINELYLGIRNTTTRQLYFRMNQVEDTVYLTSTALEQHFSGSASQYAVYESYPSMTPSKLRRIDVDKAEDSYTLIMPGDDKCTVDDRNGTIQKADVNLVGVLQNTVCNINWAQNVEYHCEDWAAYGLDKPSAVIYIEYGDGDTKESFTLTVGNHATSGQYYVRMNDSMQVHTVRSEYIEKLTESSASSFWSLSYSFVSIGDIDSLEVEYVGNTYLLERKADNTGEIQWLVDGMAVEKELFTDFYYACVSVTAQERVEEVPDYKESPALNLIYHMTDGSDMIISYYKENQTFYTVIYENGTKAAHTNRLYVNTMIQKFEALISSENIQH